MRVTSEVMVSRTLDRLRTRLDIYERRQTELATGRRILVASDDPAGARRASSLRGAIEARQQEQRNASDATGWLDTADSQLQAASERVTRVRELTVRASSTSSPAERQAIALEIRSIAEDLTGIANTRHAGRSLFGGFSDGPAVEQVGGAWVTHGAGDEVTRRVSDTELVRVNVTASDWLGFGSADGDLLTSLGRLADDLEAGVEVSDHLGVLERAGARVTDQLAVVGSATNRVEGASARNAARVLSLRAELSDVQDVDIAEAVMELQVQEVAYQATLQALAKALPPTLVAFLR